MDSLEQKLGYKFSQPQLLHEALANPIKINYSVNGNNSRPSPVLKGTCERLKLVGDCVINFLANQYTLTTCGADGTPDYIVVMKHAIWNQLEAVAEQLQLERYVTGGIATKIVQSFRGIFLKSIFGAIFIDSGGSADSGFKNSFDVFLKIWMFPAPTGSLVDAFPERRFVGSVDLRGLQQEIGIDFFHQRPDLLEQAVTHRSIVEVVGNNYFANCQQRLRFLGSSVIELVLMEYLYSKYDSKDPLSQLMYVNQNSCRRLYDGKFEVARKLNLEDYVIKPMYMVVGSPYLPGKYDEFVESLVGAVYISRVAKTKNMGLNQTAPFVLQLWGLQSMKHPIRKGEEETTMVDEIQARLNYKFNDPRIIAFVLEQDVGELRELQILGKCLIELLIVEHVMGIIPEDYQEDLDWEEKKLIEKLREVLSSKETMAEIARNGFLDGEEVICEDYQECLFVLFGAVYVDSRRDHLVLTRLFRRLWNDYIIITDQAQSKPLAASFMDTSKGQREVRSGVGKVITDGMWIELYSLLGYKFSNKNLAEQALTEETSQGVENTTSSPTGNPFALKMIGHAALQLFVAFYSFQRTVACPKNFAGVIKTLEERLFKFFGNHLKNHLKNYYVRREDLPSKEDPKYAYEALIGAIHVDCGGGLRTWEILDSLFLKMDLKGKGNNDISKSSTRQYLSPVQLPPSAPHPETLAGMLSQVPDFGFGTCMAACDKNTHLTPTII